MNTRTTTIRVPTDTLAEIDGLCKKTGNCRNSWINAAIDFVIEHDSEYDFGDEEESEEPEEVPRAKVTKVSYDDGKTWIDVD